MSLVAALFVVLLHVGIAGGGATADFPMRLFLRDFARFAVPFFFLASGYLIAGHFGEPGWWRREAVKRLKTLLLPYVAWSALFGLYLFIGTAVPELYRTHAFDPADWWRGKDALLFGLDLRQPPLMLSLWYLRTLFLLVLLSGVLAGAVRRRGAATLVMLGAAYLAYGVLVDWRPELAANALGSLLRSTFAPEAFFYFAAGLWLRIRDVKPVARRASPFLLVAAALLAVRQAVGPWLPYPVVIPFALYGVWCAVPATPWPKALTSLSFPIYLIHWFFVHFLSCARPEPGVTPIAFSLAFVGIAAASVAVALALRRLLPRRMAGILFGGR